MEIFPEDKLDPTAGTKEQEYHVERTLGVIGHVRSIAKKRKWQYLKIEAVEAVADPAAHVRSFYKLPETAVVAHKEDTWAVWSGEGEPTDEAFPEYEAIDEGPGSEFLKGLQARLKIEKSAAEYTKPSEPPREGSVALAGGSGLNDHLDDPGRNRDFAAEGERSSRNAAYKRAESDAAYEASVKTDQEAWAYSTVDISNHDAMRLRYKTRENAPIATHPSMDIAAIWLGKGTPTRPAFPDVQPAPSGLKTNGGPLPNGTSLKDFTPITPHVTHPNPTNDRDLPAPPKVSPHVPSAPLNELAIKLYYLSKEPLYTAEFRAWALRVSDSLHAEAARIELNAMRSKLDARTPKGS